MCAHHRRKPTSTPLECQARPRAPSRVEGRLLKRFIATANQGQKQIRFGAPHFTHALCNEDSARRVRRLVSSRTKEEEHRETHRDFMPETAEMLSDQA